MFFSLSLKVAYFAFLIKFLVLIFFYLKFLWQPIFVYSSYGSILLGCLGALKQRHLKRFLAYTSINQVGFLLAGLCCISSYDSFLILLYYLCIFIVLTWSFYC